MMRFRVALWILIGFCVPLQQSAHGEERGVLSGTVTFTGEIPRSRILDDAAQRRDLLSVDRRTKGVRDTMVYLDLPAAKSDHTPSERRTIDQVEHRFVPHMVAIQAGQRVRFTNSDAANHNVRSIALEDRNAFNIYTAVGGDYEHTFYAQRGSHPVKLSCDIHPWMTAWIFIFDHSYFAVTDDKGRFKIADVAPGDYKMVIRQPDVGYLRRIDVAIRPGKVSQHEIHFARGDLKIFNANGNEQ